MCEMLADLICIKYKTDVMIGTGLRSAVVGSLVRGGFLQPSCPEVPLSANVIIMTSFRNNLSDPIIFNAATFAKFQRSVIL